MIDGRDVMAVLSISTAPTANLNQRYFLILALSIPFFGWWSLSPEQDTAYHGNKAP